MTEPEKQCSQCLAFKPLGEFGNNKSKKDGKRSECRCCANECARQYRAANHEKCNEYARQWKAANHEKINEDRRARRAVMLRKSTKTAANTVPQTLKK